METTIRKNASKATKIIFWIATTIIFLAEALMPVLTFNSELAKQGITHLGYPDYFRIELTILKILGGIALILPAVPARIKEWAYFGFAVDFLSAFIAHTVVDGVNGQAFFPLVLLIILAISYMCYHKIHKVFV